MFQQHSTRVANINIPDFEQEDLYEKTELFKDEVFFVWMNYQTLSHFKNWSNLHRKQYHYHAIVFITFFCVFIVSILIRISKVFLDVIAFS